MRVLIERRACQQAIDGIACGAPNGPGPIAGTTACAAIESTDLRAAARRSRSNNRQVIR
jgi:hypothetical protein